MESVPVYLDKQRNLKLTLGGMKKYLDLTGINLLQGLPVERLTPDDFARLVLVCLQHEDPALTQEQVEEMVHAGNEYELVTALALLWGKGKSEEKKEASGDEPKNPESRPGGSSYGASGGTICV